MFGCIAKLFTYKNHKNQAFNDTSQLGFQNFQYQNLLVFSSKHLKAVDLILKQNFTKQLKTKALVILLVLEVLNSVFESMSEPKQTQQPQHSHSTQMLNNTQAHVRGGTRHEWCTCNNTMPCLLPHMIACNILHHVTTSEITSQIIALLHDCIMCVSCVYHVYLISTYWCHICHGQ